MIKIIDKYENKNLKIFKDIANLEISKNFKKFDNHLDDLHHFASSKDINEIRLKVFKKINSLDWKSMLMQIVSNDIFNILGQDLLIQSKLNLSIQMPGDESSQLPIHSDSWSADSPFQINLWIPLTNAFDSNSMFIKNERITLSVLNKIGKDKNVDFDKIKISKKDFIKINFGQILLFNPLLLHGNIKNKTNKTRVSLNIRVKSLFSPEPTNRNADRQYGTYYEDFNISKNTELAFKAIKTGFLN